MTLTLFIVKFDPQERNALKFFILEPQTQKYVELLSQDKE